MNRIPSPLKLDDLIAIVAPAKAIEKTYVDFARVLLESAGFRVVISDNCLKRHDYFSGDEAQRLKDFQNALDDPEVKAIVCARGGYGCVQLLDRIQWASQVRAPKWIVGFSDVTYFHQRMLKHGIASIHGTMPLNYQQNSKEAINTLLLSLKGKPKSILWKNNSLNKIGEAKGELVGGNLSILYALLGTDDQIDYSGKVLYIEDVGEPIYHLDRMLYAFSKAGILDQISGLIVGGMTNLSDTEVPFGSSYQEVILSHFAYRSLPIAFDFPGGHIDDNRAVVLGREVQFQTNTEESTLDYIDN